ncbi:hypothetical protein [Phenylobacterium sp.]|uniref:hypothetical protein n=1 Tax=Phenylobacterium sp. TaxID=1871053 RepID=UPI00374C903F
MAGRNAIAPRALLAAAALLLAHAPAVAAAPAVSEPSPQLLGMARLVYREIYRAAPTSRQPAAPTPVDADLQAFAAGEIAGECHLGCSYGWGSHLREAALDYAAQRWAELARLVVSHREDSDLPYFYLASAAYHLGYYAAAEKYTNVAYAFSTTSAWRCAGLFEQCNGQRFPDDEVKLFLQIQAARKPQPIASGPLSEPQRSAIDAYLGCVARSVPPLDDKKADARSIAISVAVSCEPASRDLRRDMEQGWTDHDREQFAATFDRENLSAVTGFVMAARTATGGPPLPPPPAPPRPQTHPQAPQVMSKPASACGSPAAYRRSIALLAEASAAARAPVPSTDQVSTLLKQALDALGSAYVLPGLIDDSGMHLILANEAERKGDLGLANSMRRRILEERLRLYRDGAHRSC